MADMGIEQLASAVSNLNFTIGKLNEKVSAIPKSLERANQPQKESSGANAPASNRTMQVLANSIVVLSATMTQLTVAVRSTQKELGVGVQQAAQVQVRSFVQGLRSSLATLTSGGRTTPVSGEEIRGTQAAFREQFGGLITEGRARELAETAKSMGVSAEQLAFARRMFMTTAMGDLRRANVEQNKFFTTFTRAGLTNKDAMEAIQNYSTLIARNGSRFADSFARAAVNAKKMGIDLAKVSQFGDTVVTDFEGFLEKSAELGAMGFNFDISRLAEVALTGDDAALSAELQSQLAGMNKNVTQLNRIEQVLISGMLGMPFDEVLRLSGAGAGTPADMGEKRQEILTKEQLDVLGRFIQSVDAFTTAISPLMDVLQKLGVGLIGMRLLGMFGGKSAGKEVVDAATSTGILTKFKDLIKTAAIPASTPGAAGSAGVFARSALIKTGVRTGGALAGLFGGVEGTVSALRKGETPANALGAGVTQGTAAAGGALGGAKLGALAGTAIAPGIGTIIGGIIGGMVGGAFGNAIGSAINKSLPEVKGALGSFFSGIADGFLTPLKDMFGGLLSTFEPFIKALEPLGKADGPLAQASPYFELLGKAIGIIAFLPFGALIGGLTLLAKVMTAIVQVATGNISDAGETIKSIFAAETYGFTTGPQTEPVKTFQQQRREGPPTLEYGMATGGLIRGPGTSISDSIPTMLSNGEYVINASAVKKIGVANLNKLNESGKLSGMRDGGLVGDTISTLTNNIPGIQKLVDGVARLSRFGEQFSQTIATLTQPSGGLGRLTSIGDTIGGKINTFVGNITSKLPSNIGGKINEFVSTRTGGFIEGIKSKALGFLSGGKLGGGGSPVESIVGGLKERAMGMVSKISGIGGIIGKAANIFGGGGIKGLASAALGKIGLGGLLGGAAAGPIGTIGSLAAPLLKRIPIVGGVLSNIANAPSKLIGGAFKSIGGLFGRKKKTPTVQPSIASMLGGGEDAGELSATMLPQLMGAGGLDAFNIAALAGAPPPNIQAPAATQQVKVDISNLEQKFDQLIRAFSNIQVNMDGNKVGNVLVNSTKTAANVGPIKTQSIPTL